MSETKLNLVPETQQQRWVKYGANVVLVIVVVILLGGLTIYLAQRNNRRFDTTASGAHSLKPQTVNIISNLNSKVKLVSLYSAEGRGADSPEAKAARLQRKQTVQDLLMEYKRKGKNIDVDFIDPKASPAKEDGLIQQVTTQYGGEVAKYKQFLDGYEAQRQQVKKRADDEAQTVARLPIDEVQDQEQKGTLALIVYTVQGFGEFLDRQKQAIDRILKLKPPDFKGATESVRQTMDELGQKVDLIITRLGEAKSSERTPEAFKQYAADSVTRYQEIKKLADGIVKQIDSLGDLKLDQLRTSLKESDSILVMGPNDLKVIPFDKVWRAEDINQIREYVRTGGGEVKPSFAGEQQISTAIVSLTSNSKPKVVFVRPGGQPLTNPGIPGFQAGGPLSDIAERLREYNFDVVDKDLSGQYAMQMQMQGMPAPPEPSDQEIKDAIWVVLPLPSGPQQMQMPPEIAPKVADHLKGGGAALILLWPEGDSLAAATKDYGIEGSPNVIAVHEVIRSTGAEGDPLEEARKLQYVFDIRDYGTHEIAGPLRSLESLLVPLLPVKTMPATDCTVTPFIPIPSDPKSWGETDIATLKDGKNVTFDPDKGDVPSPLFAAAASEKKNGPRLVVIGAPQFLFNRNLSEPDPELARRGIFVSRFPANAELFMNCIYWLARQDTMIAISPSAMEVPRIATMSDAALNFWRIGLLLIGLPGLVIASGIGVYFSRRD